MQSTQPLDATPVIDSMTNQVFLEDGHGGETGQDGESTSELAALEPNQILQVDLAGRVHNDTASTRMEAASNSSGTLDHASYSIAGLVDNWRTFPRSVSASSGTISRAERNTQSMRHLRFVFRLDASRQHFATGQATENYQKECLVVGKICRWCPLHCDLIIALTVNRVRH